MHQLWNRALLRVLKTAESVEKMYSLNVFYVNQEEESRNLLLSRSPTKQELTNQIRDQSFQVRFRLPSGESLHKGRKLLHHEVIP